MVGDRAMAVFDDRLAWGEKLTLFSTKMNWRDGAPEPRSGTGAAVVLEADEPLTHECRHLPELRRQRAHTEDGWPGGAPRVECPLRSAAVDGGTWRARDRSGPRTPMSAFTRLFVDEGVSIGRGTAIWHFCHVLEGSTIGEDCSLGQNVVVGPNVSVGDRCRIQNNVSVYQGVTLGNGVFCGPLRVHQRHQPTAPRCLERTSSARPSSVTA